MPQIHTAPIGHRPRVSLPGRIKRRLRRLIEPGASRILTWCKIIDKPRAFGGGFLRTATERRLAHIEARAWNLEGRLDRAEWGKEAVVERINTQDHRVEHNANLLASLEPMVHQAFWGRQALVDRCNEVDWRSGEMDNRIRAMQNQIDEYVIRPLALELDALALSRRLATIEDRLDALLTRMESGQSAV